MSSTISRERQAADNVLARLRDDAESVFEAAEQILQNAVSEGRDYFDPQEAAILRTAGYEDVDSYYGRRIILARVSRVRALKDKAGSDAEYSQSQPTKRFAACGTSYGAV